MSGYTEARMVQLSVMESVLVSGCQSVNWSISCSVLHVRNVKTEIRLFSSRCGLLLPLDVEHLHFVYTDVCLCSLMITHVAVHENKESNRLNVATFKLRLRAQTAAE